MKNYSDSFIQSIGNTPLIKLKAASEITGCNIYGKAEYFNPGESVKDRAAFLFLNIQIYIQKKSLMYYQDCNHITN